MRLILSKGTLSNLDWVEPVDRHLRPVMAPYRDDGAGYATALESGAMEGRSSPAGPSLVDKLPFETAGNYYAPVVADGESGLDERCSSYHQVTILRTQHTGGGKTVLEISFTSFLALPREQMQMIIP